MCVTPNPLVSFYMRQNKCFSYKWHLLFPWGYVYVNVGRYITWVEGGNWHQWFFPLSVFFYFLSIFFYHFDQQAQFNQAIISRYNLKNKNNLAIDSLRRNRLVFFSNIWHSSRICWIGYSLSKKYLK